jgi:hypothetical protein
MSYWRFGSNANIWYGIQQPLFRKEKNILFQNTGIVLQVGTTLSPAYVRYGVRGVFSPIEVLDVSFYTMRNSYFPIFQNLVDYDSRTVNYGRNTDIDTYSSNNDRHHNGGGWQAGVGLTLKAKVQSFLVLINGNLDYWNITSANQQGEWLWEPEKELLIRANGESILDGATLFMNEWILERQKRFLRIGSITVYRHAMSSQDSLLRSGLIAMYQSSEHLSHILLAQVYLEDRAFDLGAPFLAYSLSVSY